MSTLYFWGRTAYFVVVQYAQNLIPEVGCRLKGLPLCNREHAQEPFTTSVVVVPNLKGNDVNKNSVLKARKRTAAYSSCPAVSRMSIWHSSSSKLTYKQQNINNSYAQSARARAHANLLSVAVGLGRVVLFHKVAIHVLERQCRLADTA